jgi:DNA modification methylase
MMTKQKHIDIRKYLLEFNLNNKTDVSTKEIDGLKVNIYSNEFWTSKQRQANSLHEISYRACFKPQLPHFFIELFTEPCDIIYDPFAGRGTTIIEAAIMNRNVIANDVNPLSKILCKPRLFIPDIYQVSKRLEQINTGGSYKPEIDLTVFFHKETLNEIIALQKYLDENDDEINDWIRMVATNRLTGHSKGFFSVYTLPPNQAVSLERQKFLNKKRNQKPEYRNVKQIILKKSKQLIKDLSVQQINQLKKIGENAKFLNRDSAKTFEIKNNSVQLTVTSPPYLDVVQYANDNWLRFWFNNIDPKEMNNNITITKNIVEWNYFMSLVFKELYRVTTIGGYVAFEVGDIKNGKIHLDEHIVRIGNEAGFECLGIMVNQQNFTKTANIWGISNNMKGTNSNKIILFKKR